MTCSLERIHTRTRHGTVFIIITEIIIHLSIDRSRTLKSLSDEEKDKAILVVPDNFFGEYEFDYLNQYMHENKN